MKLKLGILISPNRAGFHRYIDQQIGYIKCRVQTIDYRFVLDQEETEAFLCCFKVLELDSIFNARLTSSELEAINYLRWHRREKINKPNNYDRLIESSYQKWIEVFGTKKKPLIPQISKYRLGAVMRYIRELNEVQITKLSKSIGVERITVMRIEKGERLPSLEYVYRFSRIFNIKVDYLIELSSD